MQDETPYAGLLFALSLVLLLVQAALVRRPLSAFLFGVAVAATYVACCSNNQGLPESGGVLHVLCGGAYSIGFFYLFQWLRRLRKPPGSSKE